IVPLRALALFIQGCARSGNTLIRELCVAGFENAVLVTVTKDRAECDLPYLVNALEKASPGQLLVAGRNRPASLYMDRDLLCGHPDIAIIWMLRNPLDVLTSLHKKQSGFYVDPYRLIASLNLYAQFKNAPQVITVTYEDLVLAPDRVQEG